MKPRIALVFTLLGSCLASAAAGTFDQIQVTSERQRVFKEGRQKFVITVKNTSKLLFKGTVRVIAVDATDNRIDSDTILLNDGLPPDDSQKFAILWFKDPARIATVKYEIFGSLREIAKNHSDVPFEELGRRPGMNYMNVFVYTPKKDRSSLEKIVKIYKERYAALAGFQVFFFNDRKRAARNVPMSDAAIACLTAQYWYNKNNGKESLDFNH
jgi:hypothetical protein